MYDVHLQNFMCAEFVKFEKDLVNEERFADLRVKVQWDSVSIHLWQK